MVLSSCRRGRDHSEQRKEAEHTSILPWECHDEGLAVCDLKRDRLGGQ